MEKIAQRKYIVLSQKSHDEDSDKSKQILYAKSVNEAIELKTLNPNAVIVIPKEIEIVYALEKNSLKEFEDYLHEEYFGKKVVVIYGNCHTTVISDYLALCAGFRKEYALYRIKPIQTIKDTKYFDHPVFRCCDVFIHQSIQLANRYGEAFASENIIRRLKPGCKVISIPNVYGLPTCFFPQYTRDEEYKDENGNTVFFRDKLLDSLGNQLFFSRLVYKKYLADSTFSQQFLEKELQTFFNKVIYREKDWDIKCSTYIMENYKTVQLFYDPNHPTNEFLRFVTLNLLELLGVDYIKEDIYGESVGTLTTYEMPILPEVKKQLGMVFPDNTYMRLSGGRLKGKYLNTKDYVYQYLAFLWQNKNARRSVRMLSKIRYQNYRFLSAIRSTLKKPLNAITGWIRGRK